MFHCGQEAYFSGHLFYIHAPSCTIISTLHALNTWMLLSPDSLVSIFPCLGAVWIDLLHVNLIWKDSGMEQRKARTLSFTCQLLKHIRDSWSLNRMIRSFVYFDVYLSATIYDSGYVHISQHPRSSDVFQSCLTLAFIIYVGWWILQDSSKPRFKGSCPSMRSFCHGRTLSDGYICNGMGVSENGACMGMPVYRKKKTCWKNGWSMMIHKILGCPIFRPKSGMLGHPAKFRRRFKEPELRQVHRIWAQEGARLEMEG